MCSVRIPPKTEDPPCVCLGNKRGRRLLGGVWAGYLDLVLVLVVKECSDSLGLPRGFSAHRTNEEAK